jgi:Fe2+ transport system protein FeoA
VKSLETESQVQELPVIAFGFFDPNDSFSCRRELFRRDLVERGKVIAMIHPDSEAMVLDSIPIDFLQAGEIATVVHLDGDACCIQRLQEIGLLPGARLQMLQTGSPCIIAMEGRRLSLRIDCHTSILLLPSKDSSPLNFSDGPIVPVDC